MTTNNEECSSLLDRTGANNKERPSLLDRIGEDLLNAVINQAAGLLLFPADRVARMIVDHDDENHITTIEIVDFPETVVLVPLKRQSRNLVVNKFKAVKTSNSLREVMQGLFLMISEKTYSNGTKHIKRQQKHKLIRDVVRNLFASIIFLNGMLVTFRFITISIIINLFHFII
jgi:hypothetical protein